MKKTIEVVGAVIENERGEILCALRSPDMSLPNLWEFPGGKIESGEAHAEALQREIREELSCEIAVADAVEHTLHEYEAIFVHLHTYKATITNGTPAASEHAELRWVKPSSLHELEWAPADIPAIHTLQQLSVSS